MKNEYIPSLEELKKAEEAMDDHQVNQSLDREKGENLLGLKEQLREEIVRPINALVMTNKIEKLIIGAYSLQVVLCVYFLFEAFSGGPLGATVFNSIILGLLFLPFFLIFTISYKRKYKDAIIINTKNKLVSYLKYSAWIIFFTALITLVVSANLLNKDFAITYFASLGEQISMSYWIIRDLAGLIWPVILFLFAINFYHKKDVNSRYLNLKNATWAMFIFGVLIEFHQTIGLLIYDIELLVVLKLK